MKRHTFSKHTHYCAELLLSEPLMSTLDFDYLIDEFALKFDLQ